MSRREIAYLAFKILATALYVKAVVDLSPLFVQAILEFGKGMFLDNALNAESPLYGSLLWVLAGWWIGKHAAKYAADTFPIAVEPVPLAGLKVTELWAIASVVMGLYLTVPAVQWILETIVGAVAAPSPREYLGESGAVYFATTLFQLAFGAWLILHARHNGLRMARRIAIMPSDLLGSADEAPAHGDHPEPDREESHRDEAEETFVAGVPDKTTPDMGDLEERDLEERTS